MSRRGVGIIGTNWGVHVQLPAFRAAGLEIVAIAGRQEQKTRRIAAQLDVPFATSDWQALVAHDAVELVSIVTPPNLHCEMCMAALAAGKHVLCEKPMALRLSEARQMLELAQSLPGRLTLIDHELRFLPALRLARQLVASGGIGRVRRAEVRAIASVRANLRHPWNWWSDATQGGGVLGTIGTHQTDILRYILDDEIIAAQGFLTTFITERPQDKSGQITSTNVRTVTADDFATFHLRFGRGGVAVVIASMVARMEEPQSITLYGDEGTLLFLGGHLMYASYDEDLRDITPPPAVTLPDALEGISHSSFACFAEATVYMGQALRAALDGDLAALAPAATFVDGLRVQQVIDAVRYSSANSGDWVELDPPLGRGIEDTGRGTNVVNDAGSLT